MEIEAEEGSFKEFFQETDFVEVTFCFLPCFEDDFILLINDGLTITKWDNTLHSGSRWGQEELWKDIRKWRKWTVKSKDKDKNKGKVGDIRGKNFLGKGFMIGKQSVGLCSYVDLVD